MGLFSKLFNIGVKTEESITNQNNIEFDFKNFSMMIDDVFTIIGRGTVVTGKIASGGIRIGDEIKINNKINTRVTGIESFRKQLDSAKVGDNVGLLLENVESNLINRGDILSK